MGGKIDSELLYQRWLHAHEEDTPATAVYRPANYPLPPARGRDGFDLGPDHAFRHLGIGRGDARSEIGGKWELKPGDPPMLILKLSDGEERQLAIISVEKDRLVVRK